MGLHTYCIVPLEREPAAGLRGVDDVPVLRISAGSLGVWASTHRAPPAATLDRVRAHGAAVAAALDRTCTPVPIRFGQWFETETALGERVGAEQLRWADLLTHFAGRAEHGVTVVGEVRHAARDVRADPTGTGTAYMKRLARRQAETVARRQVAEEIARSIERQLGGLAVDTRVETPHEGAVLARLAHLVAWTDEDAYHVVMRELSASRQDLTMQRTGPWPPWSFVG